MPPKVPVKTTPVTPLVIVKPANTTNTTAVSNITNTTSIPAWNDTQLGEKFYLEVISESHLRLLYTSKTNLSLNGTVRNLKSVDIVNLFNQSIWMTGNQTIILPNMTS